MLFDIRRGVWDAELLRLFRISEPILPEVRDCAGDFGETDPALLGAAIPIRGMAGDQQAATIGQGCFAPGMVKSTYGTGCFALLNTGETPVASRNRLLTTIAYQLQGKRHYALEGAIFVAGAAVQWLRDGLGIISHAKEAGILAAQADPAQRVVLVPAFAVGRTQELVYDLHQLADASCLDASRMLNNAKAVVLCAPCIHTVPLNEYV